MSERPPLPNRGLNRVAWSIADKQRFVAYRRENSPRTIDCSSEWPAFERISRLTLFLLWSGIRPYADVQRLVDSFLATEE